MDSVGVIEEVEDGVMDLDSVIEGVIDPVWLIEDVVDGVYVIVVEMELEAASDCVIDGVLWEDCDRVGLGLIDVEGGAITS
jgi:hypothetical protein